MSHSWGDNVFRNFLQWITDLEPDFAEEHLEAYLDIAGPILGVPKSFSALLSGKLDRLVLGLPLDFLSGVCIRLMRAESKLTVL